MTSVLYGIDLKPKETLYQTFNKEKHLGVGSFVPDRIPSRVMNKQFITGPVQWH